MLISLVSTTVFASNSTSSLPNWIDSEIEIKVLDGNLNASSNFRSNTPKDFRLPAEYEPAQAVVLGNKAYRPMLTSILQNVVKYGNARVWNAGNSLLPFNTPKINQSVDQIFCGLDSAWMRDYGPIGIVEGKKELAIVDSIYRHWQYRRRDDVFPECLSSKKNLTDFSMNLILDGGNYMVDSAGNLFMTKRTYQWNSNLTKEQVDNILKSSLNVKKIHAIDFAGFPNRPLDGTGHIDMIAKLVNDETVLIVESNHSAYKPTLEKAVSYFQSIKTPKGKNYKIIRVPGFVKGRFWYTYSNSLIVNNLVLVPIYSARPDLNEKAIKAYQRAMPNHKIVGINSDASIVKGGSIHCVTQLIPRL